MRKIKWGKKRNNSLKDVTKEKKIICAIIVRVWQLRIVCVHIAAIQIYCNVCMRCNHKNQTLI